MRFIIHEGLKINTDFSELLSANGLDSFESLFNYAGGVLVKKKPIRSVFRISLGKRAFYLKRHYISGFQRLKGLFRKRRPDDGRNEWDKMVILNECGISTMTPVAYGEAKTWGMPKASLTLTEELYDCVRFTNYIASLKIPPHPPLFQRGGDRGGLVGVLKKRELTKRLALIAKRFHDKGFNHRDFYLGHFFINPFSEAIFMVDLQRVQRRPYSDPPDPCSGTHPKGWVGVPLRWLIKDLAQMAFSAKEAENFSRTDLTRLGHAYFGVDKFTIENKKLIKKIIRKAERIRSHTVKMY